MASTASSVPPVLLADVFCAFIQQVRNTCDLSEQFQVAATFFYGSDGRAETDFYWSATDGPYLLRNDTPAFGYTPPACSRVRPCASRS